MRSAPEANAKSSLIVNYCVGAADTASARIGVLSQFRLHGSDEWLTDRSSVRLWA